ncbi:MAG: adenosylmethionine--8-amino-7-oxononanoate transaminase [Bacteriovoracaceae bacterium]
MKETTIWRPYTQEKTATLPQHIKKAEGCYYFDQEGNKIFDGISSWWVNIHGHSHPKLAQSVSEQMEVLQQIIFAGYTHEQGEELAQKVVKLLDHQYPKVFFSDNGSTAVEVGIKMALQYWSNHNLKKNRIIAFKNGYHGDTFGARAVTDAIKEPTGLSENMTDVHFITAPLANDPNSQEESIQELKELLNRYNDIGAFIFEPMVQGVAGMKMQDPTALNQLLKLAHQNNIITIADEVMTGFYRTGKRFAIDYLDEKPNIICLAKALTGGILPLSLTLCQQKIYEAFYSDDKTKALLHGHSFTGNALGCAVANASLEILEDQETQTNIKNIEDLHNQFKNEIVGDNRYEVRTLGTILAIEFKNDERADYFNSLSETLSQFFISKKMLLRPLGNVIYLIPPYCTKEEDLLPVYKALKDFIRIHI